MNTKTQKKIGFIIPSLGSGGAERVLTNLSNALSNKFDITLFVFYEAAPFYRLDDRVKVVYFRKLMMDSGSIIGSIVCHYKLLRNIRKEVKKNGIELVVGFMTTANIYTVIISKWLKLPSIISERVHPDYSSISGVWKKLRRIVYPKTNYLVVQTETIKAYFSAFVQSEKIKIISNPVAPNLAKRRSLKEERKNIILNVGRLDHQKNQGMLIKAFAKVDNTDWELLLIGDGTKRANYEQLIESLKITDRVKLIGNVKDVATYYNRAKIFVLTSRYEGSPNALIEAMYFGLACISTDCPTGPRELITDGINGYLVAVDDQNQLEKRLEELMLNNQLIKALGDRAKASVGPYDIEIISPIWEELMNSVINN